MKKSTRVSHVEEIELLNELRLVQRAMDQMVSSNLGLVNNIVKKFYYKNDQYSFEDLFQEGVIGLMKVFRSLIQKKDVGSPHIPTTGSIVS